MNRVVQLLKWLAVGLPLVAVVFLLLPGHRKVPAGLPMKEASNNPDRFYLCATNSGYDYRFVYDPRAADQWLFHTGGPVDTNPIRNDVGAKESASR